MTVSYTTHGEHDMVHQGAPGLVVTLHNGVATLMHKMHPNNDYLDHIKDCAKKRLAERGMKLGGFEGLHGLSGAFQARAVLVCARLKLDFDYPHTKEEITAIFEAAIMDIVMHVEDQLLNAGGVGAGW